MHNILGQVISRKMDRIYINMKLYSHEVETIEFSSAILLHQVLTSYIRTTPI